MSCANLSASQAILDRYENARLWCDSFQTLRTIDEFDAASSGRTIDRSRFGYGRWSSCCHVDPSVDDCASSLGPLLCSPLYDVFNPKSAVKFAASLIEQPQAISGVRPLLPCLDFIAGLNVFVF